VSLYKRGGVWWSRIIWSGQVLQRSTKARNKDAARSIEATWLSDLAKGEAGIISSTAPTLAAFKQRFFDYLPAHVAPRTVAFYKDAFAPLVEFKPMAAAKLNHIDAGLVEQFIAHRIKAKMMPATVNNSLRTLRRALHLAKDWKVIARVPKIGMLPGERKREFVFSADGLAAFLDAIPTFNMLHMLVPVLVDTGLRLSEALNLTWETACFTPKEGAKRGYVQVLKGKSDYAKRYVPLTGLARVYLKECAKRSKCMYVFTSANGRRKMSRHWASEQFREIRDKLKLPWDCVIHSCRHTFCTRLGERGCDAFTIQKLAGHSSITISQRYVHPTGPRLESAIGLLEPVDDEPHDEEYEN
jgi:integrase